MRIIINSEDSQNMNLVETELKHSYRICGFDGEGAINSRLLSLGVIPGAEVVVLRAAPLGDPIQVRVDGTLLSIRLCDAQHIQVSAL